MNSNLDVKNLSSRKLWELLPCLEQPQQYLAEQELLIRKHYLDELNSRAKHWH